MNIVKSCQEIQALCLKLKAKSAIHFVPTMGNLHLGHLSLVKKAKEQNEVVVVSLFINPTQFNNPDDFTHYPKTLDADIALLEKAGVDIVFTPNTDDVYVDNFAFTVQSKLIEDALEGQHRPGHFEGVLTIVLKLIDLTQADFCYLGEKDFEQLYLIEKMVQAFFLPVKIVACPTVREDSGLAMSSRNNRLNDAQKRKAEEFAHCFLQKDWSLEEIHQSMTEMGIRIDYLRECYGRRLIAAFIDDIRLIDNYLTSPSGY